MRRIVHPIEGRGLIRSCIRSDNALPGPAEHASPQRRRSHVEGGAAGPLYLSASMTTTSTARQATASTFARGGRRGERGRRQLVESDGDRAVSVLVVDDSRIFRRGMTRAVQRHDGLELAGEADSGEDRKSVV